MNDFDVRKDTVHRKGRERLSSQTYVVEHFGFPEAFPLACSEPECPPCDGFVSKLEDQLHKPESVSSAGEESFQVVSADLPSPFHVPPRQEWLTEEDRTVMHSERTGLVARSAMPSPDTSACSEEPGAPSLGNQINVMADKARQIERKYICASRENEQLKEKCGRQAQEIIRLSDAMQILQSQLRTRFENLKQKDTSQIETTTSTACFASSCIAHSDSPKDFDMKCMSKQKKEENLLEKDSRFPCDVCKGLFRRHKAENRQQLEHEKVKQRNLELKIVSLQKQIHRYQNEAKNPDSFDHSENLHVTSQDRVTQDLLTQIEVLQQQLNIAVEDFEKERSDRARAVSSHNKLKENFGSLAEKVRVLKRKLVEAHSKLTDFVARNSALQMTVHQLQSELRTKDDRLSQLLLTTGSAYSQRLNVPQTYIPSQPIAGHYVPKHAKSNNVLNVDKWSCTSCTYVNAGQRTVCEICGRVNNPQIASYTNSDRVHPSGRNCRLVSRGLSTDEGLADLALHDSAGDLIDFAPASSSAHSL